MADFSFPDLCWKSNSAEIQQNDLFSHTYKYMKDQVKKGQYSCKDYVPKSTVQNI